MNVVHPQTSMNLLVSRIFLMRYQCLYQENISDFTEYLEIRKSLHRGGFVCTFLLFLI